MYKRYQLLSVEKLHPELSMANIFLVRCYSVLLLVVLTRPCRISPCYPHQNWTGSSSAEVPCNIFWRTWPSFFNLFFESLKFQIPCGPIMSGLQWDNPPHPSHAKEDLIIYQFAAETSSMVHGYELITTLIWNLGFRNSNLWDLMRTPFLSVFKGIESPKRGMG